MLEGVGAQSLFARDALGCEYLNYEGWTDLSIK